LINLRKFKEDLVSELKDNKKIKEIIGLPMEIFCTLEYVGKDQDGNLVFVISKRNKEKLEECLEKLSYLKGKDVYIYVDLGNWN